MEPNPSYDAVEMLNEDIGKADHTQLVVGCTLVDTKREDIGIPIRIMDPTDESVHLHAGTVIGLISEVEDVKVIAPSERESNELTSDLYSACGVNMHVCPCNKSNVNVEKAYAGDLAADYCKSEWTENLQNLYTRSSELLSSPECEEFSESLDKFPHSFAESRTDLGRTSMTPHGDRNAQCRSTKISTQKTPYGICRRRRKDDSRTA